MNLFGEPRDEIARQWRSRLLATVEPHMEKPLLLSGGVDSATILAALVDLGDRPVCYSFRLADQATDHPDLARSKLMCRDLGLDLRVVDVPTDEPALLDDVIFLMKLFRTKRKTHLQCAQPVMHLARRIAADGFRAGIVGTGAVCLDDRRVAMIFAYEGEAAAREYRRMKLDDKDTFTGTGLMHRIARHYGVPLAEPYSEEPLRSHALALDYAELNRPRQKGIAIRAFPGFWERPGYYRRNSPLQVASGVREWHDRVLLSSKLLNVRGSKAVAGVYNDIWNTLGLGPL